MESTLINPELPSRVQGDELEGLFLAYAPVFHGLGRFVVQVASQLVIVGIEGYDDSCFVHQ